MRLWDCVAYKTLGQYLYVVKDVTSLDRYNVKTIGRGKLPCVSFFGLV